MVRCGHGSLGVSRQRKPAVGQWHVLDRHRPWKVLLLLGGLASCGTLSIRASESWRRCLAHGGGEGAGAAATHRTNPRRESWHSGTRCHGQAVGGGVAWLTATARRRRGQRGGRQTHDTLSATGRRTQGHDAMAAHVAVVPFTRPPTKPPLIIHRQGPPGPD